MAKNPLLSELRFDESLIIPNAMRTSQALQLDQFSEAVKAISKGFDSNNGKLDSGFGSLSDKLDSGFGSLNNKLDELPKKIAAELSNKFDELPKRIAEALKEARV